MSIWNKILLGLIFVASFVFFVFAARTLKTHAAWKKCVADHEAAIAALEEANFKLREGEPDKPGIRQLRLELDILGQSRTRIWWGCRPEAVGDTATVNDKGVSVIVESPVPHQIAPKMVLFAFDETDIQQGGRYLGKFTVIGVADKRINLQPAYRMTDAERNRLAQTKGAWSLYENLPLDDNQLFAELDEATKKAMLPAATVAEYLQDAFEAGQWKRKLRDYRVLLDLHYRRRAEMIKQFQVANHNLAAMTAAVKGQEEHNKYLEGLREEAKKELKKLVGDQQQNILGELPAVVGYLKALETELANAKFALEHLAKKNQQAAERLRRAQADAIQYLEERARRIARAGSKE
mgnify:CR=1 FL=1